MLANSSARPMRPSGTARPACAMKSSSETLAPSRWWRRTIWSLTMTPTCSELASTLYCAPSCDSTLVKASCAARLIEVGALSAPGALAPILSTR